MTKIVLLTNDRRPKLAFLKKNVSLFTSVIKIDESKLFGEYPLDCDEQHEVTEAFFPQLREVVSSSFMMGDYGHTAFPKANHDILERMVVPNYSFSVALDPKSSHSFPILKELRCLDVSAIAAWKGNAPSFPALSHLTLQSYDMKAWESRTPILAFLSQHKDLKELDISLLYKDSASTVHEFLPSYLDSDHRVISADEACQNLSGLTAAQVRFSGVSLWTALMMAQASTLNATDCDSIFQQCHKFSSDCELVETLLSLLRQGMQRWRTCDEQEKFAAFLETKVERLVNQTLLDGRVASIKVVLLCVLVCRIQFLPQQAAERWWARFLLLLENAELPAVELLQAISRELRHESDAGPWLLRCLSSADLRAKYPPEVFLSDVSEVNDPNLIKTLMADTSFDFLTTIPLVRFGSATWAIPIIFDVDNSVNASLDMKRAVIAVLRAQARSCYWSHKDKLPSYFADFFKDDSSTKLCMDTLFVFPRLLYRFAKPQLAITCMELRGDLILVEKLVSSEGAIMPGLLESPFQFHFVRDLWGLLLAESGVPSSTPLRHWYQCLTNNRFRRATFFSQLAQANTEEKLISCCRTNAFDVSRVRDLVKIIEDQKNVSRD